MSFTLQRLRALFFVNVLALGVLAPAQADDARKPGLLVFAAASLTDVLGELSQAWETSAGATVRLSFAASSVLARQIEAGGAADVFVSADQEWMDYLQARHLIDTSSRRNLAGNRLVLIAPADSKQQLQIRSSFDLAAALGRGRLATADPDTVPAGRYARAALISLGVWDRLADRVVRADNVRGAMMLVARGEAPFGIVYATDARADPKVRVVDTFPESSHPAITCPGGVTRSSNAEAVAYLRFLASPQARVIWQKHGFLEVLE